MNFFTKFRIFGKFLICFRKFVCCRKFDWNSDTRHYFLEFGAKSGKKFIKNSQKKCNFRSVCDWISEYSLIQSQIFLAIFDEKIEIRERCKGPFFPSFRLWIPKAVQRSVTFVVVSVLLLCFRPIFPFSAFVLSFHFLLFNHFFSSGDSIQVHFVDLGESFPTHIFLQNLASIQPRTSPSKSVRC